MGFWKVYIAVDCQDEQEYQQVQQAAKDISNMRILKGKDILTMMTMFSKYRSEMVELFRLISQGGVKALMSAQGVKLLGTLAKRR